MGSKNPIPYSKATTFFMKQIPEDTPEDNLDEILTYMLDRELYDSAEKILEMVKPTYHRYDEFKESINKKK